MSRWSALRYRLWNRRRNRFYHDWIKRFRTGKGILLDIGCGDGSFMAHMERAGWIVFGTEVDRERIAAISPCLKSQVKFTNMSSNKTDFSESYFDVITLWHVFEHIADSEKFLDTVKKILKPKGLLVLQVPNIESLEARIFKRNWSHLDPLRHKHNFSFISLSSVLRQKNFMIQAVTYRSPIDKSYRGSFQNLVNAKPQTRLNPFLFNNIIYKISMDLLFIPLNIIGSMLKKGHFITVACVNEK